ncbi:MAG: NAD-dependent epimerase/dehydratase family protein [Candidatus Gottesmanbacteria bacterium]
MKDNILITGATGFVGANLARKLVEENQTVHVITRSTSDHWRIKDIMNKLIVHDESLDNRIGLARLCKKINPTIIYHLAAYGSYADQGDIDQLLATNVQGTLNILLATKDLNYRCFINTGSSSEYGVKTKTIKESDSCQPISFYGLSKLAQTNLCQIFASLYHKPIITLRLFSPYGPYERSTRFVPTIIKNLINHEHINLTAGNIRWDFIYIDDVIEAYIKASKFSQKYDGAIINIGSGHEYSNDQVVKFLFKVSGIKTNISKGSYKSRHWDTSHRQADIRLARKILDWQPHYDLANGLTSTFKWFKNYYENR